MITPPGDAAPLLEKIAAETSVVPWADLAHLFARGRVLHVSGKLELIAVAAAMSIDDTAVVEAWMQQGLLGPVSDEQARHWFDRQATVRSTVVKPWVLVQTAAPSRKTNNA